jgi:ubiquinone/menaquinone biosynthesis C-methylase UbiE
VAESYDRVAPYYDEAWLQQLRPVTDKLLSFLPDCLPGRIIDLGCGTGYTTQYLAERYPDHEITALDISERMLDAARQRLARYKNVSFVLADMLEYLLEQTRSSVAMIVSSWAIGYSKPFAVIRESSRVLIGGGALAFVVNYQDTLGPIFLAFRKCMARFPDKLNRIARPHFPRAWAPLAGALRKHNFNNIWHEENHMSITPPLSGGGKLPWLLRTGVLAGFDAMLPLHEEGPVSGYFERVLLEQDEPLAHHYVAVVAKLT